MARNLDEVTKRLKKRPVLQAMTNCLEYYIPSLQLETIGKVSMENLSRVG